MLNAIAVAVKVGVAVVLNKILAVYVGPAGYAAIGQLQNILAIAVSIAGGVIGPGVTKGTAEHFADEQRQRSVWRAAFQMTIIAAAVTSLVFLAAQSWFAAHVLQRAEMASIFIALALALPAIAVNNLLLAIINGKKNVGAFVGANIFGSFLSLLLVGLLTYGFGLNGALLAIAISPAAVLLVTAPLAYRLRIFTSIGLRRMADHRDIRELAGYGLMGLTAALAAPLSYIFIRDLISAQLGAQAAGFWQASWKISEIYLMLITLTLSVYYLPRLAEIKTATELKAEIFKVYRVVMPVVIVGALSIYLLRDFIIHVLFSGDFGPMRALFAWQLTGDVLKIGAWILSYILLGRAMIRSFIITEVLFGALFCLMTRMLVASFGLPGVAMAYAANYTIYWIVMFVLVRGEMKTMRLAAVPV